MKKSISLFLVIALVFALCACGAPAEKPVETSVPTPAQTAAPTETPAQPESTEAPAKAETVKVTLYHGDDNAEHLVAEECELPELSPEAILAKLYEMGVLSEEITCNGCVVDSSNTLMLDLSENFKTMVESTGTAGELMLMGSLVNSFLSAYGADGMILSVEGKAISTGHEIYDYTLTFYET